MAALLTSRQVIESWKLKESVVGGMLTKPEMAYAVPGTRAGTVWPTMYCVVLGSAAWCCPAYAPWWGSMAVLRVNLSLLVHESGRPSPLVSSSKLGFFSRFEGGGGGGVPMVHAPVPESV